MNRIIIKAAALFWIASVFVGNTTNAQNVKTYSGEMKVPLDLKDICSPWSFDYSSKKILGEYKYYENENGDRIWHGEFTLASDRIGYRDQILNGNYTHGKKNGQFVIGEVENSKSTGIGLVINYKMGVLDGDYTCVTPSGFFIDYNSGVFKDGLITGKIISKTSASTFTQAVADTKLESVMEGVVGANGLPEGVWTVTSTGEIPLIQKRYFRNGRLICIEERDESTGERNLCYCVFDGLNKAPDMSLIRDTIVDGREGVVYKGQLAMLVEDDSEIHYNSKMEKHMLGHYGASAAIPEHLRALDSIVRKQAESWDYTYSIKAFKDYLAKIERIKQEKEDSIRREQILIESEKRNAEFFANRRYGVYWDEFLRGHIRNIGYGMSKVTNTDGKIIKCEQNDRETSFYISKKKKLSGHFTKENVLTTAGNVYHHENTDYAFFENDEHTMIVFVSKQAAFLIVKEEDEVSGNFVKRGNVKFVYEIKDSALNCLEL